MAFAENLRNRAKFARLSIDRKAITDNGPASVIITPSNTDKVIVPTKIFAVSTFKPNRGALNGVLNGIKEKVDEKELCIGRFTLDGSELSRVDTHMLRTSDYQSYVDLQIEVAAVEGIPVLVGTELRVWFDTKESDEKQYILVNYKEIVAMPEESI